MHIYDPIKKCALCGCTAILIITSSGFICKKCSRRMHEEYHLANDFHYDFSLDNYSRTPIETTTTGMVDMPDQFYYSK